jgi:ABC-type glycerol-3-phosphate transport system substrate-binding protein
MNKRRALCAAALLATVLAVVLIPALTRRTGSERVPGAEKAERRLLRVWMISSPGGGDGWVREQLAAFEAANPGLMTYLRQGTPAIAGAGRGAS